MENNFRPKKQGGKESRSDIPAHDPLGRKLGVLVPQTRNEDKQMQWPQVSSTAVLFGLETQFMNSFDFWPKFGSDKD